MNKLFLIAKSNMKKKKMSIILLFVLVAISSLLLYTSLNVINNVGSFLDEINNSQNGADLTIVTNKCFDRKVKEILKSYKGYDNLEREDCSLIASADIKNKTKDDKTQNLGVLFLDANKDRKISDFKVIDGNKNIKDNQIILPTYLKVSCNYQVGDIVKFTADKKTYTFEVAGFSEDVMFSSPSNISMFKCYVTKDKLKSLSKQKDDIINQNFYTVTLKDNYSSKNYENYVTDKLSKEIKSKSFQTCITVNYESMKTGASMFINIIMGIISGFALLMIIVSLIVIKFNINLNIQNDIKNIGVLESMGYLPSQLRISTIIEYLSVAILGVFTGIILSKISSKFIGIEVSSSVGLIWEPGLDLYSALFSIVFIIISVLIIAFLGSNKYKKITPLTALRSGINTHNFKKNHLPLAKSIFDFNTTIGLKGIFQNKRQNISIFIIVMILASSCIYSLATYYNFVSNPTTFEQITGLEKPNLTVQSNDIYNPKYNDDAISKFRKIRNEDEVESWLYYKTLNGKLKNGNKKVSLSFDVVNDMKKLKLNTLTEGRLPKQDNEIVVTNLVLKELNAKVGDVIYLEVENKKKDFIVVGKSQQINHLGLGAKINEDGMKRLNSNYKPDNMYIFLKNNVKTSDFIKKINDKYSNMTVVNFEKAYNTSIATFSTALKMLSYMFAGVAILVIMLILIMIIKIKIAKNKKMIGIYKALGYTTKQIIWQISMGCVPVLSVGSIAGVILGKYLINPLFKVALSAAGIEKSNLIVKFDFLLITFIFITIFSLIISIICSLKVRKIQPYDMITEQ